MRTGLAFLERVWYAVGMIPGTDDLAPFVTFPWEVSPFPRGAKKTAECGLYLVPRRGLIRFAQGFAPMLRIAHFRFAASNLL